MHGLARCGIDSRSAEFSELVGEGLEGGPRFALLAEGAADAAEEGGLGAHEAAIFVEAGAFAGAGACVVFTTKPFRPAADAPRLVVDIKRVEVETGEVTRIWRSENLANGGTIGPDGRLYFAFQGQQPGGEGGGDGVESLGGVFSAHPPDAAAGAPPSADDDAGAEPSAKRRRRRRHAEKLLPPSAWRVHVNRWGDHPFNSPNDVVVRRADGSVWFTDPSYGHRQGFRPRPTLGDWVWRHDPATGATAVVADGFARPNGICFSPDESVVYVTDTGHATGDGGDRALDPAGPRSVYAFDVAADGAHLERRRLLYVADAGVPDGIKVDRAGRVYTGCADGVHVLAPSGALLGKVLVRGCEGGAANLCFGRGAYASTLFILAEGAVLSLELHGASGAL